MMQKMYEDAVSRQVVLMELDKYLCGVPFDEKGIDEVIKELPSVNPQPKTGHWIFKKTVFDKFGNTVECSSCHKKWKTYDEIRWRKENKHCPNCGVKMVEPQERSDKE